MDAGASILADGRGYRNRFGKTQCVIQVTRAISCQSLGKLDIRSASLITVRRHK
jgi:hypothetical protein